VHYGARLCTFAQNSHQMWPVETRRVIGTQQQQHTRLRHTALPPSAAFSGAHVTPAAVHAGPLSERRLQLAAPEQRESREARARRAGGAETRRRSDQEEEPESCEQEQRESGEQERESRRGDVTVCVLLLKGKMAEAAAVPPHRFFCHCCKGEVSPKLPVRRPPAVCGTVSFLIPRVSLVDTPVLEEIQRPYRLLAGRLVAS